MFPTLIMNQRIIMISEGLCDTEDWSNDAENTALRHRNQLHIIKHIQILKTASRKDFQKHLKSY